MLAYGWPGNVRELQNRLLRAVVLADDDALTPSHLPLPAGETQDGDHLTIVSDRARAGEPAGACTLGRALAAAVDAAAEAAPHMRPPLGRWLADDLVLVAFDECRGVAVRAAAALGLPDTTYARRLQRAQRDASLASRPPYWPAVHDAVVQLVRAGSGVTRETSLLDELEQVLLEQIDGRFPDDHRAGAALLGTSVPTFKRRLVAPAVAC
jgi:hypothetical protein